MYWLTGSQKFKMMKDVSDSLVGRIAVFDMSALSTAELEGREGGLFVRTWIPCGSVSRVIGRRTSIKFMSGYFGGDAKTEYDGD
jgi:hypothetical protein